MRTSAERLRIAVLALLAVTALAAVGCARSTTVEAELTVEGMHCESCSAAITQALTRIDGVETASADHAAGSAEARFRSPEVTPEQLETAIEDLGYTVTSVSLRPVDD